MSSWSGLDFFIFLIFLVNTLLGMSRGGLKEMVSLFSLCAALVIAIKFTIPLANFVYKSPLISDVLTSQFVINFVEAIGMPPLTKNMLYEIGFSISLLICFVGTFSVCDAVLAYTSPLEAFGFTMTVVNRKSGAALGSLRGFIVVLIFIIILFHLYSEGRVPTSQFVNLLRAPAEKLDSLIESQQPERYHEIFKDKDLYNQESVFRDLPVPK